MGQNRLPAICWSRLFWNKNMIEWHSNIKKSIIGILPKKNCTFYYSNIKWKKNDGVHFAKWAANSRTPMVHIHNDKTGTMISQTFVNVNLKKKCHWMYKIWINYKKDLSDSVILIILWSTRKTEENFFRYK